MLGVNKVIIGCSSQHLHNSIQYGFENSGAAATHEVDVFRVPRGTFEQVDCFAKFRVNAYSHYDTRRHTAFFP